MSMLALTSSLDFLQSIKPKAVTATTTGTTIDLANVNANAIFLEPGLWTDGTFAPSVLESTDDTTYAAAAAADLITALTSVTGTATATVQQTSYIGKARYLRVLMTVTGSPTTGMVIGAGAALKYRKQP